MLQSLLWDDEVREANFSSLDADVRVSAQELKMSASLVDNMATDFAPEKFSDEYQEQLRTLIAAKLEQGDKLDTAATFGEESEKADEAEVIDLLEALRQSVERNRAARTTWGVRGCPPGKRQPRPRRARRRRRARPRRSRPPRNRPVTTRPERKRADQHRFTVSTWVLASVSS